MQSALHLCIQVHETLAKLDKWLAQLPAKAETTASALSADDEQYMKQLERLASTLAHAALFSVYCRIHAGLTRYPP